MTPAQAAIRAVPPKTLIAYETWANNTYGYYGRCNGTGSTSYRAIAGCNNGYGVPGVGRWDGDRRESYATCHVDGNTWNLTENWGYLLCTNNNGTGAYAGYVDKDGDVSTMLLEYGNGSVSTGGTTLCALEVSGETWFNPRYRLALPPPRCTVDDVKAPSQDRILRHRILRRSLHQEEMNG